MNLLPAIENTICFTFYSFLSIHLRLTSTFGVCGSVFKIDKQKQTIERKLTATTECIEDFTLQLQPNTSILRMDGKNKSLGFGFHFFMFTWPFLCDAFVYDAHITIPVDKTLICLLSSMVIE